MPRPERYAGFCAGGYVFPAPELDELSRAEGLGLKRQLAADDARLIMSMGGNLVRVCWSLESLVSGDPVGFAAAMNSLTRFDLVQSSVFLQPLDERIEKLDQVDRVLDQLLAAASGGDGGPFSLDFSGLDASLAGIEDVNEGRDVGIRVLLTAVVPPPRFILEAPSDDELAAAGVGYRFATLWERYVRLHQEISRTLVATYVAERPRTGVYAFEFVNEPDYGWVPEEVKIEHGREELIYPLGKYVTELHLPQIPVADRGAASFERNHWGTFQPQRGPWTSWRPEARTPVLEFDWGLKFDWYVHCLASFTAHLTWGIKDEARKRGVDVVTVSGSVTHNNIDYLLRMHRADPNVFKWIDKIGIHPYHWVENDVWRADFVSDRAFRGWPGADPQTFAKLHFKRFDFLRAFAGGSGDRGVDRELRRAFGNRKLWITEFGIGSKVLGAVNSPVAQMTRFIRPRAQLGVTGGHPDVVWEDLWGAFLDQVDEQWLDAHGVECLLVYCLRDVGCPGFDLTDDDRSNLALFHRDRTPRIDAPVVDRIHRLLAGVSGAGTDGAPVAQPAAPPELYRRPWRSSVLSDEAANVMTMLSVEERQLLHWLTAHYYTGQGAIVDGGCFVGGSTVPLAEGLRAAGRDGPIDVYDLFEVEPYMVDMYFNDAGLQAGESFQPLFEKNTAHVSELLRVHAGDLAAEGWSGDPIEILFIDFAKSWSLNDFIVQNFFPRLIPGRSVVVQQDFIFALCPWVALTMEELADYFEPVAFAEYCSVVYFVKRQLPQDIPPISSLPGTRQLELIDRAIERFRGYPREVLECVKAVVLIGHGEPGKADAIIERLAAADGHHPAVSAAIDQVRALTHAGEAR